MKLSIVICVYNTDIEYLKECLSSVTNSTLLEIRDDYEIIMIDSGSDADYAALAEEYGVKLFKVKNGGICKARLKGLSLARGEYTVFCDSDDTVSHNYHLPMLYAAEKSGADIVINGWANRTNRARFYPKNDETVSSDISLSGESILAKFLEQEGAFHSFYVLWNKLYKTSLLRTAAKLLLDADYPDGSSYAEDVAINFFAFREAKRLINIHTGYYFYRIHPSQSVNIKDEKTLRRQIEDMTACFEVMSRSVRKDNCIIKNKIHLRNWELFMADAHYRQAKALGYSSLFPLIKEKYRTECLPPQIGSSEGKNTHVLLPDNCEEIDRALLSAWRSLSPLRVRYSKKDAYARDRVKFLIDCGKAKAAKGRAELIIPREKYLLRTRLLHDPKLYSLSLRLFKKGSRLRELLKKFL